MNLKPYKFIVQAVVQQVDKDGNAIGEQTAEPVVVFGSKALEKWAQDFPKKLIAAEAGQLNSDTSLQPELPPQKPRSTSR